MIEQQYARKLPGMIVALMGMWAGVAQAQCTVNGVTCTYTDFMQPGVYVDFTVSTGADCIKGTSGNDQLKMGENDQACLLAGDDTVEVATQGCCTALIGPVHGDDIIDCTGECIVGASGLDGQKIVTCRGAYAKLSGGNDWDELYIAAGCQTVNMQGSSGVDLVSVQNCGSLGLLTYNGGTGSDVLRYNGHNCVATEQLTSVENVFE